MFNGTGISSRVSQKISRGWGPPKKDRKIALLSLFQGMGNRKKIKQKIAKKTETLHVAADAHVSHKTNAWLRV